MGRLFCCDGVQDVALADGAVAGQHMEGRARRQLGQGHIGPQECQLQGLGLAPLQPLRQGWARRTV